MHLFFGIVAHVYIFREVTNNASRVEGFSCVGRTFARNPEGGLDFLVRRQWRE